MDIIQVLLVEITAVARMCIIAGSLYKTSLFTQARQIVHPCYLLLKDVRGLLMDKSLYKDTFSNCRTLSCLERLLYPLGFNKKTYLEILHK